MKHEGRHLPLPCGRCPRCYARRVSQWSFRLLQQDKHSENAWFITLTYDTKYVPITDKGYMSLKKRDVQLFFKRLRKAHSTYYRRHKVPKSNRPAIKYYAVGEYGGKTERPHYHIIMYNVVIKLIQEAWGNGHVHYGNVTGASVGYSLKYMSKQGKIPKHKNDDRVKEFGLFSQGLGKGYLTPQMISWHREDILERMYCNLPGGRKISMPRYYKNKIYQAHELPVINEHVAMVRAMKDYDRILKAEVPTYREAQQAVEAAFRRMQYNHNQNQIL